MPTSVWRASWARAIASVVVLCAGVGAACSEPPERPAAGDRGTAESDGTDGTDARDDDSRVSTDADPGSDPDPGNDPDPGKDPASEEPTGECAGQGEGTPSDRCAGNVGCTRMGVECLSCACTLCWNETCLETVCDDGGPGCEVPVTECGERAFGCGDFATPVYGGDPDVCQSGCASAKSTCAELRRCEAMPASPDKVDDATACQRTCEGCGHSAEDCATFCAPEGACYAEVLAATSCAEVEACTP